MSVTRTQLVGNVSTGASFAGIVTATSAVVGSAVTINSFGINVSGIVTATNLNISGVSTFIGISTFNKIDVKAAVETVSTASTYPNASFNNVVLECDADLGTVFTHNIGSNGTVGIVSFKNFPVTKNSATTYTIIFTQQSTSPSGTGNTTALSGIGTNIFLKPLGVTGFSTSAKVGSGSTITLSPTPNDVDIVSFMIHYNGGSTGIASNYAVYVSNNGSFRYGNIKP
jgi:hypothetical protein